MFTLPLQHNSFIESGFRTLMMWATLKRHGIECVDFDQNGGVYRPLKASRTACIDTHNTNLGEGRKVYQHEFNNRRGSNEWIYYFSSIGDGAN